MSRLVVVSNRLPTLQRNKPAAGGLAVALEEALSAGTVWFGWSGRCTSKPVPRPEMQKCQRARPSPPSISRRPSTNRYYVGFANGALWPLLHFRLGLIAFRPEDYEGYRAVNRRFAAALRRSAAARRPRLGARLPSDPARATNCARCGVRQPDRLLPAHAVSRRRRCWRCCRAPSELVEALCAYDVIGFHTADLPRRVPCLRRAKCSGCVARRRRQLRTRRAPRARRGAIPIGIDADGFADGPRCARRKCRRAASASPA